MLAVFCRWFRRRLKFEFELTKCRFEWNWKENLSRLLFRWCHIWQFDKFVSYYLRISCRENREYWFLRYLFLYRRFWEMKVFELVDEFDRHLNQFDLETAQIISANLHDGNRRIRIDSRYFNCESFESCSMRYLAKWREFLFVVW